MKTKGKSQFMLPEKATSFLEDWSTKLQQLNDSYYERFSVNTSLGKTNVWAYNWQHMEKQTLVFFPGARTCGLFWDLDNAMQRFKKYYRIFIVDVNGHPNLSEGHNPYIKDDGYGVWATQVINGLGIKKATVIGASLGGLICMKLCLASPHLVHKAILMNPAGIRSFSASVENMYYNFLPILFPSKKSVKKFFDNAAFHAPEHDLPKAYMELVTDYMYYVLRKFDFKGDYPSPLQKAELQKLQTPVYLILGDKDILFPYKGTIKIAKNHITSLKDIKIIPNTAHGIETSKPAMAALLNILNCTSNVITEKNRKMNRYEMGAGF